MKYRILTLFFFISIVNLKAQNIEAVGSTRMTVFDNEALNFNAGLTKDGAALAANNVLRLSDGRLILKKVKLPKYKRAVEITANMVLKSAGDRWDKSGSCFVIPQNSLINFIDIFNGKQEFPPVSEELEKMVGIVPAKNYDPVIEIMRFMTPFGVGAYSDSMKHRKPVYIPHWERQVAWQQDITHLESELNGEVWIGIWIDTWTKEGYTVSLDLNFTESPYHCAAIHKTHSKSLINTVYYIGKQTYPDIFARKDVSVDFDVPANAKNIRLYYITTGHGGHSEGDEFVKKENIIYVDNQIVHQFVPWRDDCASFRRFNPGSGVWLVKDTAMHLNWETRTYELKEIEERIASSDYSRSNWCPGTDVLPVVVPLPKLSKGKHSIRFSIPQAQASEENKQNHWLVSAYLVWEE